MEWRRRDVSARCSAWGLVVPRARPRRSGGIHQRENPEEPGFDEAGSVSGVSSGWVFQRLFGDPFTESTA